jgi:16S rRNA (cytosine1402-N4)-methyltransferase
MDPDRGQSAAQWLAGATEEEISGALCQLGEERFHRRVARNIVKAREAAPIISTVHLAHIIADAIPTRERSKHPATRSFLAIRMFVNHELEELRAVLEQALDVLAPYGRLVVISFHSVEDRIVKRFLRKQARALEPPLDLPVPAGECGGTLRVLGRARRASDSEVAVNPRARSALLRVAERSP